MDRRSLHLVLDADALNLVAKGVLNWTDAIGSQTIMTPHPREAARLLSALLPPVDVDQIGPTQEKQSKVASVQSVQANRLAAAQQLVVAYGANLLIKGAGTVIASLGVSTGEPELCSLGVCSQGNPGMAVAGMGDVLSGLLGALLAQGVPPAEAVGMGVVIHAAAGDALWQQGESPSIRPTELLAAIQKVMGAMRQEVPSLMTTAAEV
jgi:NAD(P)H-hydrate epimerase